MRQNAAFQFIPELIGDFSHVMELSGNPKRLYIETAIKTLYAATDVFTAFREYTNTKKKKQTEQNLRKRYNDLEKTRFSNYEEEAVRKLDVAYEKVKSKVRDGKFRDKEVREFISSLQEELRKAIGIFKNMQADPDYPDRSNVEEVTRRTMRVYKNLLTIYIDEDKDNG